MALAKATVVARIRHVLGDEPFEDRNTSDPGSGSWDDSDTFTVADGTLYDVGSVLEFQDDFEQVIVTSISSNTLTVRRGHNATGSTGDSGTVAAHATGSKFVRDPVYQGVVVVRAVHTILSTLWPRVYIKQTQSVTLVAGTQWYAADAGILDLSSAVQMSTGSPSVPKFYGGRKGSFPIRLVHGLPTGSFASGAAFYIPFHFNVTNTVLVNGIARLNDDLTGSNYDDLSDDTALVECVIYFAAADLVGNTEVMRTTGQDISMGDITVQPSARTRTAAYLRSRGEEFRQLYILELDRTLPRMPQYANHGRLSSR